MAALSSQGAAAIVLAAGKGTRAKVDGNKAYLPLAGRRMVSWSLEALSHVSELARTVLVIRAEDRDRAERTIARETADRHIEIIEGGSSRHDSEYKALEYLAPDIESGVIDIVLVHDAARPLAGPGLMRTAILLARDHGGAVPALIVEDLMQVNSQGKAGFLDPRDGLMRVQTPQAFRAGPLLLAYRAAVRARFEGTDTSSFAERFSDLQVRTFRGDERNIKVTRPIDLFLAERLLAETHYRLT